MHTIGLDISKKTFDAAIRQDNHYIISQFSNDLSGIRALKDWISENQCIQPHICMEATGSYYELIADDLSCHYSVSVVNPLKIKSYAKSVLARTKNDKQDAILIADYCFNAKLSGSLKTFNHSSKTQRDLDHLTALRQQLISMKTATQNRKEATQDEFIQSIHQTLIKTYEEQIHIVDAQIQQHIEEDTELHKKAKLLESIDCIGNKSASLILNYLTSRTFQNVKQYIAFLGLCPSEKQSGTSIRGRGSLTNYGHRRAKSVYFMPALVAYRLKIFPELIKRLEAKGKPKKVIITAIMRKLATIAYYIYTKEEPFDRQRYRNT